MISQETIQGLIDALNTLSDATNDIVHGGDIPQEASVINSLNNSKEMIERLVETNENTIYDN